MIRARAVLGLCAVGAMLAVPLSSANAGAFSIYEQGARAMGRASAFAASPSDPSAIFYNPAGLAFVEGTQIYAGATMIIPSGKFYGTSPYPGYGVTEEQSTQFFFPPCVYISHQLNEKLVVGIGVHTPFGLGTEWENPAQFTGRYVSTNAAIQGVAINPTVAYKVNDQFSVGVGLDFRVSKIIMEQYVGALNPNTNSVENVATGKIESDLNSAIGFNFGLLYKATDELSLGLAYRAAVTMKHTGSAIFTQINTGDTFFDAQVAAKLGDGEAENMKADFNFPFCLTVGVAYQLTEDLLAEVDVNYFGWSVFEKIEATGLAEPTNQLENIVIEENYDDSLTLRVGLEWWKTDTLALRCGYLYDQSPMPAASISPMLPDATRNGGTVGVGFNFGKFTLDAALMYLVFNEADTEKSSHSGFDGVYESSGLLFGLSLGYPIGR